MERFARSLVKLVGFGVRFVEELFFGSEERDKPRTIELIHGAGKQVYKETCTQVLLVLFTCAAWRRGDMFLST